MDKIIVDDMRLPVSGSSYCAFPAMTVYISYR